MLDKVAQSGYPVGPYLRSSNRQESYRSSCNKSLTWARGRTFGPSTVHVDDQTSTFIFCDPQSPWHRARRDTNGLLRQSCRRAPTWSVHSQAYLNTVARQLNERPLNLQFDTPAERFTGLCCVDRFEPAAAKRHCAMSDFSPAFGAAEV